MNPIAKVDQWLIGTVFEPFAWRCQYRYKFGHPQLARASYLIAFVTNYCLAAVIKGDLIELTIGILLTIGLDYIFGRSIEKDSTTKEGWTNPMRSFWWGRALLILIFVFVEITIGPFLSGDLFKIGKAMTFDLTLVCAMYFAACNAMPPWYRQEQDSKEANKHLATKSV